MNIYSPRLPEAHTNTPYYPPNVITNKLVANEKLLPGQTLPDEL
ncbi:MAG: hypothetical protein ACLQG5_02770 [Methanobacterium sp.]